MVSWIIIIIINNQHHNNDIVIINVSRSPADFTWFTLFIDFTSLEYFSVSKNFCCGCVCHYDYYQGNSMLCIRVSVISLWYLLCFLAINHWVCLSENPGKIYDNFFCCSPMLSQSFNSLLFWLSLTITVSLANRTISNTEINECNWKKTRHGLFRIQMKIQITVNFQKKNHRNLDWFIHCIKRRPLEVLKEIVMEVPNVCSWLIHINPCLSRSIGTIFSTNCMTWFEFIDIAATWDFVTLMLLFLFSVDLNGFITYLPQWWSVKKLAPSLVKWNHWASWCVC